MNLGQIFTRDVVADFMTSLFSIKKTASILDPCFGGGAFLKSLKKEGFENVTGYEIDAELYENNKKAYTEYNLIKGDFLVSDEQEKYDGIIMNPPYLRQEAIDELADYGITKSSLRNNPLFKDLPATANFYMYFILKAIKKLNTNGELIVIFPGSWLQARSGKKFQDTIEKICVIEEEIFITGEIFEKNALVDVIILKLIKNKKDIPQNKRLLTVVDDVICNSEHRKHKESDVGFYVEFNKIAKVRRGLSTGWNEFFVNPPLVEAKYKTPIISSPKAVIGYSTRMASLDTILTLSITDELTDECKKHIQNYQSILCENCAPKTLYEKYKNDVPWYALKVFDCKGIIFSYFVRNDMKFVLNNEGFLARDNFYVIQPLSGNDELLLFALLNNIYTYVQLERMGKKYGAGLLKLQRYDIENLLFPNIDEITKQDKEQLREYAMKLEKHSDKKCIDMITQIIGKYSSVSSDRIADEYKILRKNRLGD